MLIYGVSYHQCLLNKYQEESSETGINRRYKNSCLPLKKDSLWIFKPHRTVLINNKTTKKHYLFFYYIYRLLPLGSCPPWRPRTSWLCPNRCRWRRREPFRRRIFGWPAKRRGVCDSGSGLVWSCCWWNRGVFFQRKCICDNEYEFG